MDICDVKIQSCTGLCFQLQGATPTSELWRQCKQAAIDEINKQTKYSYVYSQSEFYGISMPCGSYMSFPTPESIMELPIDDIPCGCGDKTHWYVRFVNF